MAPQHILPTVSYPTSVSLLARRVLARRIEIPWLNITFVVGEDLPPSLILIFFFYQHIPRPFSSFRNDRHYDV